MIFGVASTFFTVVVVVAGFATVLAVAAGLAVVVLLLVLAAMTTGSVEGMGLPSLVCSFRTCKIISIPSSIDL